MKIIYALVALLLFSAGFGSGALTLYSSSGSDTRTSAGEMRVRVLNGIVEWADGTVWHEVDTVDALIAQDPYVKARQWETYPAAVSDESVLSVEEIVPESASTPAATTQRATTKANNSTPTVTSGGESSATATPSSPAATPSTPADTPSTPAVTPSEPAVTTPSTPAVETPPAAAQDGEDIGWSDDLL
jgi:hypothetical protein